MEQIAYKTEVVKKNESSEYQGKKKKGGGEEIIRGAGKLLEKYASKSSWNPSSNAMA